MLPELPRALSPEFVPDVDRVVSEMGCLVVDHHCQICPTCGEKLTGHHCKLICTRCGYYLSCADYY